jgi:hypothetical protein
MKRILMSGVRSFLGLYSEETKMPGDVQGLYIKVADKPLGLTRRSIRNQHGRPEANADHGSSPNLWDVESSWPDEVVCGSLRSMGYCSMI